MLGSFTDTRRDVREIFNMTPHDKQQSLAVNEGVEIDPSKSPLGGRTDVFDLPFHMARDKIEDSLRTKMTSIKERMVQLQDAHKGAEVTFEATERELEAQLVEAMSIIQEQVIKGKVEEVELPEKADILISEPMGIQDR